MAETDYTPVLTEIHGVLEETRDQISNLREVLGDVRDHLASMAKYSEARNVSLETLAEQSVTRTANTTRALAIFERAADVETGLVTRPWNSPGGLSQAAMINALRESGQLDAVFDEIRNPTELP